MKLRIWSWQEGTTGWIAVGEGEQLDVDRRYATAAKYEVSGAAFIGLPFGQAPQGTPQDLGVLITGGTLPIAELRAINEQPPVDTEYAKVLADLREAAMTVGQLKAALADLPDDMILLMDTDAEGNDTRVLSRLSDAMFVPESAWSGETYNTPERLDELMAEGGGWSDEDAAPDEAIRVVVLEPVN